MEIPHSKELNLSHQLLQAIAAFPLERDVQCFNCDQLISISPFEFYAECPRCNAKRKVKSMSGVTELEDVFDAVFQWLDQPRALAIMEHRQRVMRDDS